MDYNIKEVDRLSGTTEARRAANFRWLSQQGEQTKIEALKLQTDLIRQHRRKGEGQQVTPEFTYSMLCLALVNMVWLETAQSRKGSDLSAADFERIQSVRIDRILSRKRKKSSPKKEIIRVKFYQLIKSLREKGLSWREISDFLRIHHKTRLTFSYIRECYLQLTEEKERSGA